jgi:NADH:ubiquinone oxidoreductase subunit F (NADH-binding)
MRAQYQPTIRFQVLAQVAVEAAEYIRGQCTVAQECIRHTVVEAAVVAAAAVEAAEYIRVQYTVAPECIRHMVAVAVAVAAVAAVVEAVVEAADVSPQFPVAAGAGR